MWRQKRSLPPSAAVLNSGYARGSAVCVWADAFRFGSDSFAAQGEVSAGADACN